eukprot:1357572-Amphidinium_carterae.1
MSLRDSSFENTWLRCRFSSELIGLVIVNRSPDIATKLELVRIHKEMSCPWIWIGWGYEEPAPLDLYGSSFVSQCGIIYRMTSCSTAHRSSMIRK